MIHGDADVTCDWSPSPVRDPVWTEMFHNLTFAHRVHVKDPGFASHEAGRVTWYILLEKCVLLSTHARGSSLLLPVGTDIHTMLRSTSRILLTYSRHPVLRLFSLAEVPLAPLLIVRVLHLGLLEMSGRDTTHIQNL